MRIDVLRGRPDAGTLQRPAIGSALLKLEAAVIAHDDQYLSYPLGPADPAAQQLHT